MGGVPQEEVGVAGEAATGEDQAAPPGCGRGHRGRGHQERTHNGARQFPATHSAHHAGYAMADCTGETYWHLNPSNAEATFAQSTRTQRFL